MGSTTLLPPARPLPAGAAELRSEVREFLAAERAAETFVPACDAWLSGWDESFSRRLAERTLKWSRWYLIAGDRWLSSTGRNSASYPLRRRGIARTAPVLRPGPLNAGIVRTCPA